MIKRNFTQNFVNLILILYMFLVPLDVVVKLPNEETYTKYLSLGIVILSIITLLLTRKLYVSKNILWLLLFVTYGLTSTIWADFPISYGLTTVLYFVLQSISIIYLARIFRVNAKNLIISYVIGTLVLCVYAQINPVYTGTGRLTINYSFNPNYFAGLVSIAICGLLVVQSDIKRLKYKVFLNFSIVYMFYILFLIQSRTSLFSLIFSFLFALIFTYKNQILKPIDWLFNKRRFYHTLSFLFLISIIGVLSFFMLIKKDLDFQENYSRITNIFTESEEVATSGRSIIWKNGFSLGNPLVGTGFRTFEFEYERTYGILVAPHNLYVETFVTLGLVGIFILIGFMISLYKDSRYLEFNKGKLLGYFTLFLFIFISGIGNDVMRYKYFWIGWVFLHLTMNSIKDYKKNNSGIYS